MRTVGVLGGALLDRPGLDLAAGAVHIGDAGPGHRDCIRDALLELREVTIDASVDPNILGGIVVKLGSQMIDASIRTKLNRLASAMKG